MDYNGCIVIYCDFNVVLINEFIVILDMFIINVSCWGGMDGGIDVEVGGGVLLFFYLWFNDV